MGEEDFGWGFDSDPGEEETDYNQRHPLVPDLVADDNGDITYEPPAVSENGDSTHAQHWKRGVAAGVHFTDQ